MINFIKSDFEKLPQNIRYLFIFGSFLVFNAWILDHWLPNRVLPYLFFNHFDIRAISYNSGMVLLLIGLVAVTLKQLISIPSLIRGYNRRYQIKDMGSKFDLVWFNGKLILFDHAEKKYHHVYPWETAEDLDFISYGTHVQDKFPNPATPKVKLDSGSIVDTTQYQNGGSVNTRRKDDFPNN